jgi:hypothetical protein
VGGTANILNKQSRTADKGPSSSLVVGSGLTTSRRKKKIILLPNVTQGVTLTDYLDNIFSTSERLL